jgi:DNA-directed RNA polymerase subunit M/transcription elongation factor TFIIS
MRFCPVCRNYLYHGDIVPKKSTSASGVAIDALTLECRHCGYKTEFTPTSAEEALILETNFQTSSSVSSGITVNAYTRQDPTLPHVKTIRCPNQACPSTADAALRDVIYIKTDPANLKFQYVCTQCNTQWTN